MQILFGYPVPMMLRDYDIMSMSCGLVFRFPFLDHQLLEIALRMPQRYQRHGNPWSRESFADLSPPGYLNRLRQGFALPIEDWMRGPLYNLCQTQLEALQRSSWLCPAWIQHQWHASEAGQLKWVRVWSLVILGELAIREQRIP
jgi:asparagine synthase (glutamine-hydrolysing)